MIYEIETRILGVDGEVIIKRTSLTFESAYENLGKLEAQMTEMENQDELSRNGD
jgi:hypothetical protein